MPALSFRRPRFLHFRGSRSRSPKPSSPVSHDDAAVLNDSPSSSCLSSRLDAPEQGTNAVTGTSISSVPTNSSDPQRSTAHLADRTPQGLHGQPSRASPVTSISAATFDSAHAHLPCSFDPTNLALSQESLGRLHSPSLLATSTQQSLDTQRLTYQNQGILNQAHDFTMTAPTFIDGNVNIATSNRFMEKLLKQTIPGAAFDSSARHPAPRCHPGTRLAILERCLYFVTNCNDEKKIRWVVGAAGVGKSAIMQSVAESPELLVTCHASVFFSIIGRNDGTKVVLTLSYQLAAKSESYRRLVEEEIACDLSLLQSSIPVQFNKLIVEPFIHHPQLNAVGCVLIILDGLDECDNPPTQQELLRLISAFCTAYPSSPIVWLIASRPEPHITSFFSRRNVMPTYEKEEVPVDSDDARADVEQYLRHELTEIKEGSDSLDPGWPEEQDLWKLANAAGGLFAYAHTVIRYIGDSSIGSPASQLSDVLNVIDSHPMTDTLRESHPLASLDALYARILSNVPAKVMVITRKLLLALASRWDQYIGHGSNLILLCNWLGITPDEAYAALNHLRSILRVPRRDKAHKQQLKPFHKSFIDYISDFTRSGFSPDIKHEAQQVKTKCTFRILNEAPDGVDAGDMKDRIAHGALVHGLSTGDKISLTWPVDEKDGWNNHGSRWGMYKLAIAEVAAGIGRGDPTFQTEFCIRLLTSRFQDYAHAFLHYHLRVLVFVESRREEFMRQGILKQMPVDAIDGSKVILESSYSFVAPIPVFQICQIPGMHLVLMNAKANGKKERV